MHKLIASIAALVSNKPGDYSKQYHEAFVNAANVTDYNIEDLKEAIDQAEMLGSLNLSVLAVLSACINKHLKNDDRMVEVIALMQSDNKIGAIKIYRSMMNVGLADSKAAVEKMGIDMGIYEMFHGSTRLKR